MAHPCGTVVRDRTLGHLGVRIVAGVRRMFGGFGFYVDGLLVAAAWDGAFRLRHHEHGSWVYKAVEDSTVDDPAVLVGLFRDRALVLSRDPAARPVPQRRRHRQQPRKDH